jgi:hypothetical protein
MAHAAATSHHLLELRSCILPELLDKYSQVHGIDTTSGFESQASILQHTHRDSPLASDRWNFLKAVLEQLPRQQACPKQPCPKQPCPDI